MPSPRRRLGRPVVALAIVLSLAATACARSADDPVVERAGPDDAAPDPTDLTDDADDGADGPEPGPAAGEGPGGFRPDPIAWERCGSGDCARVAVPLDYDDPTGPTIELYVTRSPATGEREGALFVNPGGPGATATDFATILAGLLPDEATERFDVVGIDPRGTGASTPVDCGIPAVELYRLDPTVDTTADADALVISAETYAQDCDARHGELLPHVGTRDVARDHDAVRAAMGDEQLSFLGFSYGTAIGQVYADLFPHRVRAMVLDGVVELGPSGLELALGQAAGFELALDRWVSWCAADGDCGVGGSPRDAIAAVVAAAEDGEGIPAPRADRTAGPGEATLGIVYAMYSETLWPRLGQALTDALGGDGSGLVDLADGYIGIGDFEIYFAVNCMDFAWPRDPDEYFSAGKEAAATSSVFGEAIITDYVRCATWPVEPDPLTAVSAPDTPPILVISTTGDPATPYEAGVAVAERLASGVLVTYEGDGHTATSSGVECIDDLVVDYLVDLDPPPNGARC